MGNIKLLKKINILILISFFLQCKRATIESNETIAISLESVVTNVGANQDQQINFPIPEIYFIVSFTGVRNAVVILGFQRIASFETQPSNFHAIIKCFDADIFLPLYENTGIQVVLKKGDTITKSFRVPFEAIKEEFKKCGEGHLGKFIMDATQDITFSYQGEPNSFSILCKRKNFTSPDTEN